MTERNKLLEALGPKVIGAKLDPNAVEDATSKEQTLVRIIAEETEAQRARRRGKSKTVRGLLGNVYDSADVLDWDDLLQDLDVLEAVAKRSGVTKGAVLTFALEKCQPSNWQALFWMRAWQEAVTTTLLRHVKELKEEMEKAFAAKAAAAAKEKAKRAAEARHAAPNGTRARRAAIQRAWATGNFATRDICAEQERDALGFKTFGTARNALRNTPDPNPWPARGMQ